jgi:hypothetical protein
MSLVQNPWKKVMKSTNQHDINDSHKSTKVAEKEWEQTDTQLAKYDQNSKWTSGWISQSDIVQWEVFGNEIFTKNPSLSSETWSLSNKAPNWMKLGYKGHLNTRNKFPKEVFPNPKISLLILDELKNLGFVRMKRNPLNQKG